MKLLFENFKKFLLEEQDDDIDLVSKVIVKDGDKILILKLQGTYKSYKESNL